MYVIKYSTGDYDSYCICNIFVTNKKRTATRYVTKFKKKIKKWKKYYKKYNGFDDWMLEKHFKKFDRWYKVMQLNTCWWEEISKR